MVKYAKSLLSAQAAVGESSTASSPPLPWVPYKRLKKALKAGAAAAALVATLREACARVEGAFQREARDTLRRYRSWQPGEARASTGFSRAWLRRLACGAPAAAEHGAAARSQRRRARAQASPRGGCSARDAHATAEVTHAQGSTRRARAEASCRRGGRARQTAATLLAGATWLGRGRCRRMTPHARPCACPGGSDAVRAAGGLCGASAWAHEPSKLGRRQQVPTRSQRPWQRLVNFVGFLSRGDGIAAQLQFQIRWVERIGRTDQQP